MSAFGTFTWGNTVIDKDMLPIEVQSALMDKTLKHKLDNEVSSNVIRLREAAIEKAKKDGDESFDAEEFTESKTEELREVMKQKLYDGTIGLRIVGPRGSTIENIAMELAFKRAQAKLEPKGFWPKGNKKAGVSDDDAVVELQGQVVNREQIAQTFFEMFKDELMDAAKVEHAARMERVKANKANKVPVKAKGEESLADLLA